MLGGAVRVPASRADGGICGRPPIALTGALIGRYREPVEGTPFGRYQLIELLGRGGMGEVWRAHDTTIDRVVALKMLLPHFAKDPDFDKRFRREARAAARLANPHVVPIHDVGEIDGRLYVTMQLIDGVDLDTLLKTGPLEAQRAVHVIEQIASALHSAHRAGLVHRDVKPSNILLADNDFAYLIDFGIARAADDTALTSEGSTIGTWAYMAPERFQTGDIEPSSDIYALACVLYQCLTGEPPFPGTTLEQIAVGHMVAPPPRASETRNTVPRGLDRVIETGLAKQTTDRYPTAVEMAAAARQAITEPTSRPHAAAPTRTCAGSSWRSSKRLVRPVGSSAGLPTDAAPRSHATIGATAMVAHTASHPEAPGSTQRPPGRRRGVHRDADRGGRCGRRREAHRTRRTRRYQTNHRGCRWRRLRRHLSCRPWAGHRSRRQSGPECACDDGQLGRPLDVRRRRVLGDSGEHQ